MIAAGSTLFTPEGSYDIVVRVPAFFQEETYLVLGGRLVKADVPLDAEMRGVFKDHLLVSLRSDWNVGGATYREGSLLSIALDDLLQGKRSFAVVFEPSARVSLSGVSTTRDRVVMTTLDNVISKMYRLTLAGGAWSREEVELPGIGSAGVAAASDEADVFFFSYSDFLTPSSLYFSEAGKVEKVKSLPAFFDATGMKVAQYEATSKDGTKIPYFVEMPKGFVADGKAPALLYGYGGFEQSMTPGYSGVTGAAWLVKGGVRVVANIRGGGEFGPAWHKAALKENHYRNFDDFIAVAEDLVARNISSPRHLGIMGGSQGGLLVGGTFTKRPDLFNAVVCQVPLADMQRYNKLLAGASWMAEYGNPDVPEEWAYIKTWSPYQNLRKDAKYPKVFFWTNTRDDRVHPAHARKMVAKMESLGHPVYYFENTEGGHGSGTVNKERAEINALEYAYLWKMLR
jgi:prolyl oligopeptidase